MWRSTGLRAMVLGFGTAASMAVPAAVPGNTAPAQAKPPAAEDAGSRGADEAGRANTVQPRLRDEVLPPGWRTSTDVAWTTTGDANGLHVLVARASDGYTWRTVASLSEPGFDADLWIGNACLTGSGKRLVVVYGPRVFTNDADLFDLGGFGAVVDLQSGRVRKLPVRSSLAYFNPGCGTGEAATLTQLGGRRVDDPAADSAQSRLLVVDAVAATSSRPITVATEVTSAVPVGDTIVAAGGGHLLRANRNGRLYRLAATAGTAFRLTPDAEGQVVFLDRQGENVRLRRAGSRSGTSAQTLAVGPSADVGLARGAGGKVFLTGQPQRVKRLPATVRRLSALADSVVSTHGGLAVNRVRTAGMEDPRAAVASPDLPREVRIESTVLGTGRKVTFAVTPQIEGAYAGVGRAPAPVPGAPPSPGTRSTATAGSPTEPIEDERYCSVSRNDPRNQAMQPKPRQVEWAVDQAITDSLHLTRPANWKNLGMPAYSPQGLFPSRPLVGGGRVPAQILLGIAAQESNMWQASRYSLPGVTGNPLIGNYYGLDIYNADPDDDWDVNFADADCGYGVMQVTDGMRLAGREKPGEVALAYQTQRAVALDFATNVAAGLRILQEKWNQTRSAGMIVNNGDPAYMENWFFAVWAYNSGFYPNNNDGLPWGVGWLNNPINPRYNQQRKPFLEETYADAKNPQWWPYPEKIMGWAGHPIEVNESPDTLVAGYRAAWWSSVTSRNAVKPPMDLFCDQSNSCHPGEQVLPNDPEVIGEPAGPCTHRNNRGYYDLRCWYNRPVAWKGGPGLACDCGNEVLRFDPGYEYQADGDSFPPRCNNNGLPAGTRIIDDVRDTVPSVRPNCDRFWANAGQFSLRFAADSAGRYPSKVDFHQIGGGFGSHFYFGYTHMVGDLGGKMKVTGTWAINPTNAWTRVLVHIPDQGAYTRQADYKIYLPGESTSTRHRSVPTRWQAHKWLDLGVFDFRGSGTPKVELSNVSQDGSGIHKIVWDAIAVQPLAAKPRHFVVAMGDSFSSGEGAGDYTRVSDQYGDPEFGGDQMPFKNSCRRSPHAWARRVTIPGASQALGPLDDQMNVNVDFHHIACAGAQTHHVMATRTATGQPAPANAAGHVPSDTSNHELTQIDQGFLDENTTLVMLTIGGNDAEWTDVVLACALADCLAPGYTLPGQTQPMVDSVPARLRSVVKPDVRRVITEIRHRAPNAWIILAGYPQLFRSGAAFGANPAPGVNILISESEVAWLNDMARVAAVEILYSDIPNRVNSIDIRADFAGHELGVDIAPNWLNGYILGDFFRPDDDDGERNDDMSGAGSFHPNIDGFGAYGGAASDRLNALNYRW